MEHLRVWLKDFNLFILLWLKAFFLKELNFFFLNFLWFNSKNWTSFEINMTKRIEPFFNTTHRIKDCFFNLTQKLNMIQSIEPSFSIWLKELNLLLANGSKTWTFSQNSENLTFFGKWLKDFCKNIFLTRRIEPFSNMTPKNWTLLWTWLTETFLSYNSKN